MTAAQSAEAQARLTAGLREIVLFFTDAGISAESIELMNSFIDKHLTTDLLSLAEGYGKCMAFIDHDELIAKLVRSYAILIEGYVIERKIVNKRIRILKEDKKTDPEVLARQENLLVEVDARKATAMVTYSRLKAMNSIPLHLFKDPKFKGIKHYKDAIEYQKLLLGKGSRKLSPLKSDGG